MSRDEELRADARAEWAERTEVLVRVLRDLVDPVPGHPALREGLRQAHALKGVAPALGWTAARALLHALETRLLADPAAALPSARLVAAHLAGLAHRGDGPEPRTTTALRELLEGGDGPPEPRAPSPQPPIPTPPPLRQALTDALRTTVALTAVRADLAALAGARADEGLHEATDRLDALAAQLHREILAASTRLVVEAWAGLTVVARDTAGPLGKLVELTLDAPELRVDAQLLDALREPVAALVRNAVVHGIETPAARRSAAKPSAGRVVVAVRVRPSGLRVVVADDGAGLDLAALGAAAVASGAIVPDDLPLLDAESRAALVFAPGLSTAARLTADAGRGTGLDLVREAVSTLGGRASVETGRGSGARFTLDLPPRAASFPALRFQRAGAPGVAAAADVQRVDPQGPAIRWRPAPLSTRPPPTPIDVEPLPRLVDAWMLPDESGAPRLGTWRGEALAGLHAPADPPALTDLPEAFLLARHPLLGPVAVPFAAVARLPQNGAFTHTSAGPVVLDPPDGVRIDAPRRWLVPATTGFGTLGLDDGTRLPIWDPRFA